MGRGPACGVHRVERRTGEGDQLDQCPLDDAHMRGQRPAILDATPLARIGQVADICKAARFLIEDADYCTGQVIAVDGGRLLR